MFHKVMADGLFTFASVAVLAAMVGWSVDDIWLASTQWMLVAIVLLLIAIYVKLSAKEDEMILKSQKKNGSEKSKHTSFQITR
jgi:hypothetical protein